VRISTWHKYDLHTALRAGRSVLWRRWKEGVPVFRLLQDLDISGERGVTMLQEEGLRRDIETLMKY
jgi:hypothetical protein